MESTKNLKQYYTKFGANRCEHAHPQCIRGLALVRTNASIVYNVSAAIWKRKEKGLLKKSSIRSLKVRAMSHTSQERHHGIVSAPKKVSKGRPTTPPNSRSVVTDSQV